MPDGQQWPRISIVTPSYNQALFIEKTIRSILLQGYPNLEYIIIDGGSTDKSVEIIKKYEKWLTYWVSEPDRGQSHAVNKGFEKASGEVFAWLNSDDYYFKDAFRSVSAAYHESCGAGGWFGGCLQVNVEGETLVLVYPNRLDADALASWGENAVNQSACFFSKEAWQRCGPLDEELHYAMDFDLWIKIALEFSIVRDNSVLAAAVVHENAKTQRNVGMMYAEQFVVKVRHGYERYAIQDIAQLVNRYIESQRKVDKFQGMINWVTRFPLFRPIRPIVRIIWRKL
jgi:glycosyltransferase involved in cell wall biosynthesis